MPVYICQDISCDLLSLAQHVQPEHKLLQDSSNEIGHATAKAGPHDQIQDVRAMAENNLAVASR